MTLTPAESIGAMLELVTLLNGLPLDAPDTDVERDIINHVSLAVGLDTGALLSVIASQNATLLALMEVVGHGDPLLVVQALAGDLDHFED